MKEIISNSWSREMELLRQAVHRAGTKVTQSLAGDLNTKQKANGDFVTWIDFEVNRILKESIKEDFPDDGWLSEETQDSSERFSKRRVWIVDPIDGTRELIKGIPEFAISAALVQDGIPVVGIIFNPLKDEFFSAVRGEGVYLNEQRVDGTRARTSRLSILASRSEFRAGKFKPFEPHANIQPVGSIAYKLALVAAGKADATVSLDPKNEWDIAAGVLLVEESGGKVTDKQGAPFVFNQRNTLVSGVVAACVGTYEAVEILIRENTTRPGQNLD